MDACSTVMYEKRDLIRRNYGNTMRFLINYIFRSFAGVHIVLQSESDVPGQVTKKRGFCCSFHCLYLSSIRYVHFVKLRLYLNLCIVGFDGKNN